LGFDMKTKRSLSFILTFLITSQLFGGSGMDFGTYRPEFHGYLPLFFQQETNEKINQAQDKKLSIAVIDFNAKGISTSEASALTDRLISELVKLDEYRVMERELMKEILIEQGFQQTGCTSDECIVEVGQIIAVQQMVGGSISKVGDTFSVSAKIVSVRTGEIVHSVTYDFEGDIDKIMTEGMKNVALLLIGRDTTQEFSTVIRKGVLNISSDPIGAEVWLDGKKCERATPINIDDLDVGKRSVYVQSDNMVGYKEVEVFTGDTTNVHIILNQKIYPARSLIMSLAIPGAGQWYAGSKMKALMFVAFEAGSWAAWYHMKQQGEQLRVDFERFADDHWSLQNWVRYSGYLTDLYGDVKIIGTHHLMIILPNGSIVPSDTLASDFFPYDLDPLDSAIVSIMDSEYYENIGKYDQFVAGWDDVFEFVYDTTGAIVDTIPLWWDYEKDVGDSIETIVMTKHREKYLDMREDHNIALKWAGYAVSAIMFNHVISALEAAWETKKQSHKQKKVETSLGLLYSPYNRFGIGGIKLSLSW